MTQQSLASLTPRAQSWNKAMAASPGGMELSISKAQIEGTIPPRLHGTRLLSNGPGWTKIGEQIAHPFDGHGYVRTFDFLSDGSCDLRAKFIETPAYLDEAKAGKLVHRGLATNVSGHFWQNIGMGMPRNVANTTITRWGDRLLAGWEGGAPFALDAETLETRGEELFGGVIAGQMTLAHMKHDAVQDRLILCSIANGKETGFTFREIGTNDEVISSSEAKIKGMLFTHDFAMTDSHFILGGNPLKLKPMEVVKMLMGASTMLRAVTPNEKKPGVLHLVPRSGGPTRTISLPGPAFVIHYGNAFERDGTIVVDACVFSHFELGNEFGYTGPNTLFDPSIPDAMDPQRLVRITIPAGATEATWQFLAPHGIDFPRFHPDHEGIETPLMFGATRKDTRHSDPFDSIIRVDLRDQERPQQLWTAPDNVFVGEPIFVPDPEHDDKGHILAILSDGLKEVSTLAIFDATDLEAGPVASIATPLLPIAFHGDWDPEPYR